jgi:hypothetical protein
MVPKTPKRVMVSPQLQRRLLLRRRKEALRVMKMKQGPSRKLRRGRRRRR